MNWRELVVAPCRTHHLQHRIPAYAFRYTEVGKFHSPGLAAAVDEFGATHISADGLPAYAARFLRTFGFYEDRAAVQTRHGWAHVFPDGTLLTGSVFAWCGNFQEGRCTVRSFDGQYHHITAEGIPAYSDSWRYVGDFRDGLAVVQAPNGLHTHVDNTGRPAHGRWYQDLGVYHKGFATAQDDVGWTHLDQAGEPVYGRRFAAAEPFYNGQARMVRHDGGLEVIDERGTTVVELRLASPGLMDTLERRGAWGS